MRIMKKIFLYLKMIKFHRIKNAVRIYMREGISGVKFHFYLVKDKERGLSEISEKIYDITPVEKFSFNHYDEIFFECCDDPLVSIIIPAYNQFAYTYNCLKHIYEFTKNIQYEIIVGDDCSTDITSELENIVKGIKVIHNTRNYQFLTNCNRLSKEAAGKYIVLLNNDTQVQKGWLEALLKLIESDETVGLVGSKLVYPNGLVQEAGGIVWKDATVLQFGNNRQSEERVLNFVREADYVSGASIIIKRELWNEIGGFDERFAPAYYEDVDLAFKVRERGYKIMYQPESEVIHFEGVTESLDKEREEKINVNRKRFLLKWKNVLQQEHYDAKDYPLVIDKIKTKEEI